ncbi:MAG: flagellar biosynthesis protein FlgM [Gammaproteobacteria bacterium]|nr:MAG: flagellar biosynthesis protein FlgM [Gammaproteobacteria bacterium]
MRWQGRRKSQNIEDRRRLSGGKKAVSIGGLIIAAIMAFLMKDASYFTNAVSQQGGQTVSHNTNPQQDQVAEFTSVILANLEDTWGKIFNQAGLHFRQPKLVLYELKRMGASGDFAFAYVIAHEYGHHISNLIGTLPKVHRARQRLNQRDSNRLSILLELQADCFAGVWANYAGNQYQLLEPGDIQEGLQAAASVGDDALIGNRPEKFTHGTSQQRMQWLRAGMQSGNVGTCDTFKTAGFLHLLLAIAIENDYYLSQVD